MSESLVKGVAGILAVSLKDKRLKSARQLCQPRLEKLLPLANVGGVAVLTGLVIMVPQCKIRVTKFYAINSGADIATGANKPEFGLGKCTLTADSAVTEITLDAASRIHYDSGVNPHEIHQKRPAVLKTDGTEVVDGGHPTAPEALVLMIDVNGTPADMGSDEYLTFVVEYVLED